MRKQLGDNYLWAEGRACLGGQNKEGQQAEILPHRDAGVHHKHSPASTGFCGGSQIEGVVWRQEKVTYAGFRDHHLAFSPLMDHRR